MAGQMLRRGPSGSGPIRAAGPLWNSLPPWVGVSRSRSDISSTGTSTVISIGLTRPASMMVTSRLLPPRKRAVSDNGRCVAESPIRCGSVLVIAASRSRLRARCAPRLVSAIEWISSTITQRTLGRICRAALVRRRKSDSGVVIRMSGGWRSICLRSRAGVSPVRIATVIGDRVAPMRSACKPMPRKGACRLRSMSTVSALSGETYSTRQRSASAGTGSVDNRSMHQKKAASVLPLPVGADIRVCWPAATDRQPPSWTSVGAGKAPENQARAAGENRSRTVGIGLSLLPSACRSKLERAKQLLRSQMTLGLKDAAPGIEQAGVVGGRAADPLAERHDLPVEIFQLAARSALEALQRRGAIGTVRWEIAGQSSAKHEVAQRHRKCGHEAKCACPAALVEAESAELCRLHALADRRNRQPCEALVAQRFADRQASDRHNRVVQIGHQLGPPSPGDIGDALGLHSRAEQREDCFNARGRLRKGRAHL